MTLLSRLRRRRAGADPELPAEPPPGDPAVESPGDPAAESPGDPAAAPGDPARREWRRSVARVLTVAAGLLLLAALTLPNQLTHLTPAAFLRLPAEALLAVGLVLVLPARARPVAAAVAGAVIGLLAVLKVFDMGFFSVLDRPFDPVLDWPLVQAAVGFLRESMGEAGATAAVIVAVVLALAVLAALTLAAVRVARPVSRHRNPAAAAAAGLGVVWVVLAVVGVQVVPGVPVAAHHYDRVQQVTASLQDRREFAAEAAVDDFRDVPAEQLLTGLRGRDVVIAWVESYGRDAVEDPRYDETVGRVLEDGERRLGEAGFAAQSGYLTAATAGGASWLNHATLRSGLWVDNQQRYRTLLASDRLTLNRAFQQSGWHTVAVMPGIFNAWPEGAFFGFDEIYDRERLDYRGQRMNWGIIPDQYTMSAFERLERDQADRPPVMADIALLSSHAPWTPVAPLIDWERVGDGSVYDTVEAAGEPGDEVMRDPSLARSAYGDAVAYSLATLISYVETFGDDDLVFVFLGDHQPAALVTGEGASRDVPITIVTRDEAVLERISGWGWQDGLRPGADAPVWPMDTFRDEFLTAFS